MTTTNTTDPVLTVRDAATRAGVTTAPIYEAINSGALKATRPGGKARTRFRIRESAFKAWLDTPATRQPVERDWSANLGSQFDDYYEDHEGVRVHGSQLSEFRAQRRVAAADPTPRAEHPVTSNWHPVTGADLAEEYDDYDVRATVFPDSRWTVWRVEDGRHVTLECGRVEPAR